MASSSLDIRYVAGFFDGEGSIGLYKASRGGGGHRHAVTITNTSTDVLIAMVSRFGGTVRLQRPATTTHRATYEWSIQQKAEVEQFLTTIRPFLRVKAEQADVMLGCISGTTPKETAVRRLKALKKVS